MEVKYLIIHCADTYADMDIGVEEIRRWHKNKGWDDVGYHHVIRRNGVVEDGRDHDTPGAHAYNPGPGPGNSNSIGICMVGGKARDGENAVNFTRKQMDALYVLVSQLVARYPGAEVIGHCDVPNSGKTCPNFNAKAWWYG